MIAAAALVDSNRAVTGRGQAASRDSQHSANSGKSCSSRTSGPSTGSAERPGRRGATFTDLIDAVRREKAERYLRDTDMPLGKLAGPLAYSEESVLTHACRRWFGTGPADNGVRPTRASDSRLIEADVVVSAKRG